MGSWARVFHTAPPQPASKARRTWYSEFVGGPEASQKGLGALTPQKSILRSGMCRFPRRLTTEAQRHREDRRERRKMRRKSPFTQPFSCILPYSASCLLCVSVPLWLICLFKTRSI